MKVDLDGLERKSREWEAVNNMGEYDPEVVLALIARIRDLEILGRLLVIGGDVVSADRAREILDEGAVIGATARERPTLRSVP